MPYLDRPQARIFYQYFPASETSNQPCLTLINGHTRSHKDFKMMIKFFNNQGYDCLALDNRGSGSSEIIGPFKFNDLVEDIHQLWQKLTISQSHVLGISMGGMIAQVLAVEYPSYVRSLSLVSTCANPKWISGVGEKSWGNSLDDVYEKMTLYFAPDFVERNKLLVQSMAKQIWKGVQEGDFSVGAQRQREAMKDLDISDAIERIKCPCQIMHGNLDQIIHPDAAQELHERIPNSQLVLLNNVGHLLLAEGAKDLYERTLGFIESLQ